MAEMKTLNGYEIVDQAARNKLRVNLLRPILGTTTKTGVTITNNGDGTYTLNGTAEYTTSFFLTSINGNNAGDITLETNKTYKVTGSNSGAGKLIVVGDGSYHTTNSSEGLLFTPANNRIGIWIQISQGVTCNNDVFKPMIITDLNATYDDFVSYDDSLITGINSGLKMDLLWENATTVSSFSPQTINAYLNNYKFVYIIFMRTNIDSNYPMNIFLPIGTSGTAMGYGLSLGSLYRYIDSVSYNGITFGHGAKGSGTAESTSYDENIGIPWKIYGVK